MNKLPTIFDRALLDPWMKTSVGFDHLFDRLFDDFMPAANSVSYPPYNIRKIDENSRQIEIALAGYGEEDISITLDGDILSITGRKNADVETDSVNYVYKGVAARSFARQFRIAEGAVVGDVGMLNGMLIIPIHLPKPEKPEVRHIPINGRLSHMSSSPVPTEEVEVEATPPPENLKAIG